MNDNPLAALPDAGSLLDLTIRFIALALIAATFLSVIYIIVGGLSFILAAGNEEKIKKAVRTIRYALMGFLVAVLGFFAVAILTKLLGLPFPLTFSEIVDIMRQISDQMRSTR